MFKRRIFMVLLAATLMLAIFLTQAGAVVQAHETGKANEKVKYTEQVAVKKNKALFNPLLNVKVKGQKAEFDLGLVNISGKTQDITVSEKPYSITIENYGGQTIVELPSKDAKAKDMLIKPGRAKALDYTEAWDLRYKNGNPVEPGRYSVNVKWEIKVDGKAHAITTSRFFYVQKNNVKDLKPVVKEKIYVALNTLSKDNLLHMEFSLVNKSSKDVEMYFSGKKYDYVILDKDGKEIYRWSDGRFFTLEYAKQVLKAGKSLNFKETWDYRDASGKLVEPGKYTLRVEVTPLEYEKKNIDIKLYTEKELNITAADINQVYVTLDTETVGNQMKLNFALVNRTGHDLKLHMGSGQKYDFVITDAQNREIYRWSYDKFFTMALVEQELKKGESLTFSDVWDFVDNSGKKVKEGDYKLSVHVLLYDYEKYEKGNKIKFDLTAEKDIKVTKDNIKYDIDVVMDTGISDGQMEINFALRNRTGRNIILHYRNGQQYDVIITDAYGKEVYKWSDKKGFITALVDESLEAGQKLPGQVTWDFTDKNGRIIEPGEYKIEVVFIPYDITKDKNQSANLTAEKVVKITQDDIGKFTAVTIDAKDLGKEASISFALKNASGKDLQLTFNTSQEYDIVIKNKSGKEVYRWSDDRFFMQMIHTKELKKDKALSYTVIWDKKDKDGKRVPSGFYTIEIDFKAEVSYKGEAIKDPKNLTAMTEIYLR